MKPVQLKENVWWVGGIDWDLRDFHGYVTQKGTSYNAYLIIDEKITLIDNVKHYLFDEMMERIRQVIDPARIDQIVQNHIEPDHSSGLPLFLERYPDVPVYTNAIAIKGLKLMYKKDWNFKEVKTGDVLNLGKRNLTFMTTPMVHWPDNMVTYCPEEKILFSNDGFGQHIASSERFDTDYPFSIAMDELQKYYANIILPYSQQVQKVLEAVSRFELDIIAPSHGLIWTTHIQDVLRAYKNYAYNRANPKQALIIYDTMWKSTQAMAYAVGAAFENLGIQIKMLNLKDNPISDIMTQVMEAKYIAVGSPTINSSILPSVAAFLYYLKGLSPKNRVGLAFGSYGWGGQGTDIVHHLLGDPDQCGFQMMEPLKHQYIPSKEDLKEITDKAELNIMKFKEEK